MRTKTPTLDELATMAAFRAREADDIILAAEVIKPIVEAKLNQDEQIKLLREALNCSIMHTPFNSIEQHTCIKALAATENSHE